MRWQDNRQSDNVEDRRDDAGGGGMRFGGIHLGLGGLIVVLLGSWLFGVNPMTVLGLLSGDGTTTAPAPADRRTSRPPAIPWRASCPRFSRAPRMSGACCSSSPAAPTNGRDWCCFAMRSRPPAGPARARWARSIAPQDRKVYIDLGFYQTLRDRLGSPGDFAQAYVIAHEVGHHVQNLLGTTAKVDALRARENRAQANSTSVRVELQADCFAGVWAFHAQAEKHWLEQGDIESALNAASHIGDDALQRQEQGRVVPESFTHGTSAQRVGWFKRGLANGRVADCDTFDAATL